MPSVIDKEQAFNFCNSWDDLLPNPVTTIDTNDLAQLWGCYALGDVFVDIVNENQLISKSSIRSINHDKGDFSEYDTAPGTGSSLVSPGMLGTEYKYAADAAELSVRAWVFYTTPSINVFSVIWYMELDAVVSSSSGRPGVELWTNPSLMLFAYVNLFIGNMSISIREDDNLYSDSSSISAPAGENKYEMRITNSSGGAATDGKMELFINDSLSLTVSGIDIDTKYGLLTRASVGLTGLVSGTVFIDEILFIGTGSDEYEAIYILGLIRTLAEMVNINETIIRLSSLTRVIAETINILLIGDSNLVIDHETGGYDQYDTPPDCGTIETPGINSLYLSRIQATSITPGIKAFTAPTGIYFSIDFWLDMSCFTLQDTAWHIIGIRIGDGVNGVLWTEFMNEVPDSMRAVVVDDNAATQNGSTVAVSRDTLYRCKIIAYKASSGAALDGRVEFYLNSVLVDTITGLDLFTQFANMTQLEAGLMDEPGMDGYIDLDEINITYQASFAIYILNTIVSKIIAEIVTIPETIFRLPPLVVKLINDTVNVVSGYISARALQVSDTININSAALGLVGLLKLIAETVNINEVIVRLTGIVGQIINETVNINETKIRLTGLLRVVASETVRVVSGAALRARGLVRVEDGLIRIFEVIINPLGLGRIITGTVRVIESGPLLSAAITKVIDETINIVSAILRRVVAIRVIAEVVNVNSALLKARGFIQMAGEVVRVVSGTALRARGLVRVEDGLLRIFEVIINPLGLVRRIAETVNIDSGLIILKAIMRVIAEVVNINSGLVRLKGMVRPVVEVVNINSGLVRLKGMVRPVAEVVTVVSAVLNPRGLVRQAAELIRIYEVIAPVRGLVRIVSGTVRIASDLLRLKFITAIVSNAVNVVESVIGSPVLYTLVNLAKTGVKIIDFIRGVSIVDPIVRGVRIAINQKGVDID